MKKQHYEFYQIFTISILSIISITCLFSFFITGSNVTYFYETLICLVLYLLSIKSLSFIKSAALNLFFQSLLSVSVLFFLYLKLGVYSFEVIPYNGDLILSKIDQFISLGQRPVLWAEQFAKGSILRFFSFCYAFFIPYVYSQDKIN